MTARESRIATLTLLFATILISWTHSVDVKADAANDRSGLNEIASPGRKLYAAKCASCHGSTLTNGEFAPPLAGRAFLEKWKARGNKDLRDFIARRMPPAAPGSLAPEDVEKLIALIWEHNGPSPQSGSAPARYNAASSSAPKVVLRRAEAGAKLFARYRSIGEDELRTPHPQDWLAWRRTSDGQAFSPLKLISRSNVVHLRLVWAWTLPPGADESTPLVHDGILFVRGSGDVVEALDASTGDLLWHYERTNSEDGEPSLAKSIALFGNSVFFTTSDQHVVAVDARSGEPLWDVSIARPGTGHSLNGGPIVAKGKVVMGTGGQKPGGNAIIALDARSGQEAWRFNTIDPGESWNGEPLEKRSGGAIWTPGTYDAELGLVYFGPSATYDTAPLRDLHKDSDNEALFTNNTLALHVDTGKLSWRFNHMPNDQWDLDWAFERQIFELTERGKKRRLVLTGGKLAIFDILDAQTGKYDFSIDAGLQDLVSRIDPVSGEKTIDRQRAPGDGTVKVICPASSGGKNWYPAALDSRFARLFVPLNETCMDLVPVPAGDRALLSTGVSILIHRRPGNEGRIGRLEAFDLGRRKAAWVVRRRSPITTGVVSTAGDLVFAGFYDRQFIAYDARNGATLWQARLNDTPLGSPITYSADGRQFVAITAGDSGLLEGPYAQLAPNDRAAHGRSTTLFVFGLGGGDARESN